jgi:CheY-like chemotaxis protein
VRILVVDDNQDLAFTMATLLRTWGHEVSTAHDGEAALVAAERLDPEVIFLDLGLPGIDGYEVARRIRQTDSGKSIRLVAVTGWGGSQDFAAATDARIDFHVTKPVEARQLTALLAAAPASALQRASTTGSFPWPRSTVTGALPASF